ncbi:ribonuclease H-like domain-containing protein [Tanacetum coccineum]
MADLSSSDDAKGYDRFQEGPECQLNQSKQDQILKGLQMKFLELYHLLWTLEIDVKGGSSYDSRVPAAPTHSAFIIIPILLPLLMLQAMFLKMFFTLLLIERNPLHNRSLIEDFGTKLARLGFGKLDIKMAGLAMLSVRINRLNRSWEEGGFKERYGDDAGIPAVDVADGVSTDGYGDTFGTDEVFDLSAPSIFDSCLKDAIEKPLYDGFVKAGGLHVVPGPITGTFMPPSNKPDIDDTQFTYGSKSNNSLKITLYLMLCLFDTPVDKSSDSETTDFASCVSSVQTSSFKTNEPLASASSSVDLKNLHIDYQLRLIMHLPFPAGWHKPATRPMTRPRSHYFQQFSRPGSYNQMDMDGGRWGTAVKTSAGCSWQSNRPYMHWGSKNNSGSQQSTGFSHIKPTRQAQDNPHTNKDLGIVDSGCSRSMTGNKEKLADFVKIKGGTVTFGGGDGQITGKGTIRTSNFNFENVYYVQELQNFNLFSVSQICDTKNKVLFTDKECLVLSKEFQLPDSSQVVLRVPREDHNLYCFDLTGHPCRKMKSGSYFIEALTQALFLVVTDDFSRFSWVFFLGTKDETFYILRDFITFVENQLTKKVKAIRCDNGTEFKNSNLIELCGSKGIKRDYSVARTPQQNGVAKRNNRTLIEAARNYCLQTLSLHTMFRTESMITWENLRVKLLGFLVGYSAHSKAYRVYNLSNKKIEETLNLRYLEDKPNVQGLGHEWYFDLDYLTDSLGYTRFKSNQPAGTQDTNTHAGTHDDSDSECDEQVIVVPSFPSNHFSGPKVHTASATVESTSDYAEELARLQRQAYEANSTAKDTWNTADTVPTGSGVPTTSIPAGSINQPAGGSAVPSTPSSSVVEPVHADATPLPPGHSLGSSANST